MRTERIEGRNTVLEALLSGMPVERVLFAEGNQPASVLDRIAEVARRRGVRVESVPKRQLENPRDRSAHQGVVADVAPFTYRPLDEIIERHAGDSRSLILVLDHVTDPGNLGAIVRSAEVAGAHAVIVAKKRAAAVTAAAYKSSAGALAHLPLIQVSNVAAAMESLKSSGYWVAGASAAARETVWESALADRLVFVLGAEGEGLSRLVQERCDFLVSLPVAGRVDSLNVAQAAAVFSYEWVRRGRMT